MPGKFGLPTIGGSAVTAGGVIFIRASMDATLRAYSQETGAGVVGGSGNRPRVRHAGRLRMRNAEYVAFAAGGNTSVKDQVGDQLAVYALLK